MEDNLTLETNEINLKKVEEKKNKKLSNTSLSMLTTHGLNLVVSVFVTTFLISYIYSISENYVLNIGLFYLCNYVSMFIFYYFISRIIDRTNRVCIYRIAIIVRGIFILSVVFVGRNLAQIVAVAGLLHGFSEAFYWTSYNLMKNELVRKSQMKKYSSLQHVTDKLVNMIVPLILGKLIDSESFKISAIIILVVVVIELVLSLFIKSNRPENSSFDFKEFTSQVKSLGEKKKLVTQIILMGAIYGTITIIAPLNTIFIMLEFNSNFSLGIITSIFSTFSIFILLIMDKCTKVGNRSWLFSVSGVLSILSVILLVAIPSKITIIIFNFIYLAFSVVYGQAYDVARNIVLKKLGMYNSIAEYQASIELAMEFSRSVTFLVMVIAGLIGINFGVSGLIISVKILLVLSVLSLFIINMMLIRYEKLLVKYALF